MKVLIGMADSFQVLMLFFHLNILFLLCWSWISPLCFLEKKKNMVFDKEIAKEIDEGLQASFMIEGKITISGSWTI